MNIIHHVQMVSNYYNSSYGINDGSDTDSDEEGDDASEDNTTIVGSNISNDKYSVDGYREEDDECIGIDFINDYGGSMEIDSSNTEGEEFGYDKEVVDINSGLAKQSELEVVRKDSADNVELSTNADECNGAPIKDGKLTVLFCICIIYILFTLSYSLHVLILISFSYWYQS